MGISEGYIFFCQALLCSVPMTTRQSTAMGIAPTLTDGPGSKVEKKKDTPGKKSEREGEREKEKERKGDRERERERQRRETQ